MAIANELKKRDSEVKIVYIGPKGDKLLDIPRQNQNISQVYSIYSGKFRRYHQEGWKQILDYKTQILNIKDLLKTLVGIAQSWRLLGKIKPDIIFTRGSSVSVPVALAARARGIGYITHDSDSTPGLTNRIIAPGAVINAVAGNPSNYPYPKNKTVMVGVPISPEYKLLNANQVSQYRKKLELDSYNYVLLVTSSNN